MNIPDFKTIKSKISNFFSQFALCTSVKKSKHTNKIKFKQQSTHRAHRYRLDINEYQEENLISEGFPNSLF